MPNKNKNKSSKSLKLQVGRSKSLKKVSNLKKDQKPAQIKLNATKLKTANEDGRIVGTGTYATPAEQVKVDVKPSFIHNHRAHPKHQHTHFEEELEAAIHHFESAKEEYANTLLYPEVCMARIPFIAPVPTALARGVAYYTHKPDYTKGGTFAWSFVPEALCVGDGIGTQKPFMYGTGNDLDDQITLDHGVSRNAQFPNIQFASISAMRIVGASITISETNRLVDRAGYGIQSRVYGQKWPGDAGKVGRAAVINSIYKDEANYSGTGDDDFLRMIYAPGDFSDLHLRSQDVTTSTNESEVNPVIQGFVTGFGENPQSPIALTFEFNVVFEYVPRPILFQMVEKKPAIVSSKAQTVAENLANKVGVTSPDTIEKVKALMDTGMDDLRPTQRSLGPKSAQPFIDTQKGFGTRLMNFMPGFVSSMAPIMASMALFRSPIKVSTAQHSVATKLTHDEPYSETDRQSSYIDCREFELNSQRDDSFRKRRN